MANKLTGRQEEEKAARAFGPQDAMDAGATPRIRKPSATNAVGAPNQMDVVQKARSLMAERASSQFRRGGTVTRKGLYKALHAMGYKTDGANIFGGRGNIEDGLGGKTARDVYVKGTRPPSIGAGDDAKAASAFGASAQNNMTNAAKSVAGAPVKTAVRTEKGDVQSAEPQTELSEQLGNVYANLKDQAVSIGNSLLRNGESSQPAGSPSIGDVAETAIDAGGGAPEPLVASMKEPAFARGGEMGDSEQPYVNIGGYDTFLGNVDKGDSQAVASAQAEAQADYDYMQDNDAFVTTDFA